MDAADAGIVMPYGNGPDSCDFLGARDLWVFKADDSTFCMHYDAAGPKGWLTSLATSKDLVHWEKKGPVLQYGKKMNPIQKVPAMEPPIMTVKNGTCFILEPPMSLPHPILSLRFPI
jgi:predicted GH43/DUF377 family glycosyl hydrolase